MNVLMILYLLLSSSDVCYTISKFCISIATLFLFLYNEILAHSLYHSIFFSKIHNLLDLFLDV